MTTEQPKPTTVADDPQCIWCGDRQSAHAGGSGDLLCAKSYSGRFESAPEGVEIASMERAASEAAADERTQAFRDAAVMLRNGAMMQRARDSNPHAADVLSAWADAFDRLGGVGAAPAGGAAARPVQRGRVANTPAPVKPEHVAAAIEMLDRHEGSRFRDSLLAADVAQALADAEARVWQRVLDIEAEHPFPYPDEPWHDGNAYAAEQAHDAILNAAREAVALHKEPTDAET